MDNTKLWCLYAGNSQGFALDKGETKYDNREDAEKAASQIQFRLREAGFKDIEIKVGRALT